MCVELCIALDCLDVLTVNVETRTDFGVGIETLSIRFIGIAGIIRRCGPARFPVHSSPCVRCAVKIGRGDPCMRRCTDLWRRCLHHDRKQGDAELLNADGSYASVIATAYNASHFVTPELCPFRHIPLRFPSAISRERRVAFTNNPASIAFTYAPVHSGSDWDHEASGGGHISRQPLHLHGLARTIEIAIGDDLRLRLVR